MNDSVQRLSAALADRYAIERELGAGGMATVYLAHDLRHDRKVALKVLRPELSAILGGERFLVEIKTTANLQHPHILSLFDSGEAEGLVFYVMPYVDGESLRERLRREKQLPVDDAARIAGEVAAALDYAHRHNVVHRDIKPENILLHEGRALVADFGIALAVSRSDGGTRMTETGMSLGTPHYMAPEQAMGEREVTPKADIYALGCVLYEMLTGEPPFTGPTAQAIIARVMTEQPRSLTLQRHTIPPHLEVVVRKALEKLPADRFGSAAQFAEALLSPAVAMTHAGAVVAPAPGRRIEVPRLRAALPWTIAAAAVGLSGWIAMRPRAAPPAEPVARYALYLTDSVAHVEGVGATMAIAPDGSAFAYSSRSGLRVRYADRLETELVRGGRQAESPFFSSDGRWIGFRIGPRLVKVSLDGGAPVTVCDSCVGYNFDWGTDDTIRYHTGPADDPTTRVLMAVSARGGRATIIARPDSGSGEAFRSPTLLPHRRTVLFTMWARDARRLAALDLDRGTITRFDQLGIVPAWVDGGFVVLSNQDGTMSAVPFDADRARVTGPPVTVVRDLMVPDQFGVRAAIARNGTVVYLRTGAFGERRLAFATRDGRFSDATPEPRAYAGPRFSPDGRRIAVAIGDESGGSDVWVLDLASRVWSRLTTDRTSERPIWSPDGARVVYASNADLWWTRADGSVAPESLLVAVGTRYPGSVTPDGRAVVFQETGSAQSGIRRLAFDSAPAAQTIIPGVFSETAPSLSPDGRWLAYQSDETGRTEVYVRAHPVTGARVPVSVNGGAEPAWSRNGRELFYRAGDTMMVAAVVLQPTFTVTSRRVLFIGPFAGTGQFREYDVSPDGQRFVLMRGSAGQSTFIVVHHLFDRLARGEAVRQ